MYQPRYYPGKFILPVIVTPGARIGPLPDPRPHPQPKISVDTKFLLLMAAAILATPEKWFPSRRANTRRRPRNLGHLDKQPPVNLGEIQHCYDWKPVISKFGYPVWRCAAYASSCKDGEAVEPGPSGGEVRACVEYKSVYSPRYGKQIKRCVKYARVRDDECVIVPFPAERSFTNIEKAVKRRAKWIASRHRQEEAYKDTQLYHDIKSRGGIRPYRKGQLREEYSLIPFHLKNKSGLPLDEMASEMGIDETELLRQIRDTYPRKKKRRIDWKDYEAESRDVEEFLEPILKKHTVAGADLGAIDPGVIYSVAKIAQVLGIMGVNES